jgi:hypothetical protein
MALRPDGVMTRVLALKLVAGVSLLLAYVNNKMGM